MWNVEVVMWEAVDRVMLIVRWVARDVLITFEVMLEWNDMDETFVTWVIRNVDFARRSDRFDSVIALDSVVVIMESVGDCVESVAVRLIADVWNAALSGEEIFIVRNDCEVVDEA